jgi:hypothetical protein
MGWRDPKPGVVKSRHLAVDVVLAIAIPDKYQVADAQRRLGPDRDRFGSPGASVRRASRSRRTSNRDGVQALDDVVGGHDAILPIAPVFQRRLRRGPKARNGHTNG